MSSALTLGQNTLSLRAQSKLAQSSSEVAKSSERLSSGLRINRASDDAAGLAVAMGLKNSSRVFTQALRNVNDGISYLNVGEGALDALTAITARQLELAEQAANGSYSLTQRKALHNEANALADEFNRIVGGATFNGRGIFNLAQNSEALRIQAGVGNASGLSLSVGNDLGRSVGTGDFTLSQTVTDNAGITSARTYSTVLGDINGDGALDMIASGYADGYGQAKVYMNDGHGNFSLSTTITSNGTSTSAALLVDVNRDGTLDLVTAGGGGSQGQTRIFLNNGQGNFSLASTIVSNQGSVFGYSMSIAAADVNGDGFVDLVTGGNSQNAIDNQGQTKILLNDGRGNFTIASSLTSTQGSSSGYTYSVALADINGDGAADLIAGGAAQNGGVSVGQVKIFMNDGRGNFTLRSTLTANQGTTAGGTVSVAATDLNGDGVLDIVASGQITNGFGANSNSNIFIGDGSGNFTLQTTISSSEAGLSGTFAVAAGDVNGDGYADLTLAGYAGSGSYQGQAKIFLNDGRGNFSLSATLSSNLDPIYSQTHSVAIGDVNGDGATDIVTGGDTWDTNVYATQSRIFFASCTRTATALHINLLSQASARQALGDLQTQLIRISNERGAIGAFQSRLETGVRKLSSERDNYLAAASRITDVDVGAESSALLRQQILQQAGTSILAQANQQPALALQLLRS